MTRISRHRHDEQISLVIVFGSAGLNSITTILCLLVILYGFVGGTSVLPDKRTLRTNANIAMRESGWEGGRKGGREGGREGGWRDGGRDGGREGGRQCEAGELEGGIGSMSQFRHVRQAMGDRQQSSKRIKETD